MLKPSCALSLGSKLGRGLWVGLLSAEARGELGTGVVGAVAPDGADAGLLAGGPPACSNRSDPARSIST